PEVAYLLRFYAAENRWRMAGQGDLRGRKSAYLPRLRDDAREKKWRKAVLRFFNREKGEAGPPQLVLIERAVLGSLRKHVLLDFQSRGGKGDMEERALPI